MGNLTPEKVKELMKQAINEKLEESPPYKVTTQPDGTVDIELLDPVMRENYLLSVLSDIRHKTGIGNKAMLSELADAIVNWQPIETAPTDRTRVLVTDGFYVDTAYFNKGEWWLYECGDEWYSSSFSPTHWKDLPAPPKM